MQEIGSAVEPFCIVLHRLATKTLYFDGLYVFYGGILKFYLVLQRKIKGLPILYFLMDNPWFSGFC